MYDTESSRWQAIQSRDQAASSSFVYAVISTKIYCRPACPSRIARRANVCFYDTAEGAATAGYRPCLRCKPEQPMFNLDNGRGSREAVRKACRCIEETRGQFKFSEVAREVGLSTRYLHGLFKTVMGTTPAKYAAGLESDRSMQVSMEGPMASHEVNRPLLEQDVEPTVNSIAWDGPADPDYNNFPMLHESLALPLQDSDLPNVSQLTSNTTDRDPTLNDAYHSNPYGNFDAFPSNLDFIDPAAYLYHE